MDERRRAEDAVWGDVEARAALVRWLMAECRARLAAEDAARAAREVEVVPDVPQEAEPVPAGSARWRAPALRPRR